MSVLITGGAGYIGSHTAKLMKSQGLDVVIYDNLISGHRQSVEGIPLVIGDILNPALLKDTIERYHINSVVHFAAFSQVSESMKDPQKYYLNNVCGTLHLLKAMREMNVNTFIFSSSAAVYGEPQSSPISEDCPLKPASVYGSTKLMIENILRDYSSAYGLKYISLRYFNACGADENGRIGEDHIPETHLIPIIFQVALGSMDHVRVFGGDYPTPDGTCIRDYVHVSDLAHAHLLALEYLKNGGQSSVFNLGNEKGFSVREVIKAAETLLHKNIPSKITFRRIGDPAILIANSEKIRRALGWSPKYTELPEIIATAWKWHSNNPNGFGW